MAKLMDRWVKAQFEYGLAKRKAEHEKHLRERAEEERKKYEEHRKELVEIFVEICGEEYSEGIQEIFDKPKDNK